MFCDSPFNCGDNAQGYKVRLQDELKQLFSGTCAAAFSVSVGHCAASQNRNSGDQPTSASSTSLNKLKKKTCSANGVQQNRGHGKLFKHNGSFTVDLTNRLTSSLKGRENLEANEIELMHSLLNSYLRSDLKKKLDKG